LASWRFVFLLSPSVLEASSLAARTCYHISVSKPKVIVGMSGGVDSSLAAATLLRQGYSVTGLFISNGVSREAAQPRTAPPEADAGRIADLLGIDLIVVDATQAFRDLMRLFADEYAAGRTPNPCAICNRRIKFRTLLEHADALGAQYVATGHYARIVEYCGSPAIARAAHVPKDQSYFLFNVPRELPRRLLLPIGHLSKAQVRAQARELGLPVHDKEHSVEICFIPDNDYARLVREYRPEAFEPGPVLHVDGRTLGTHDGIVNFTIGQRRGLGIALGEPAYVAAIESDTRTVRIGPLESVRRRGLIATGLNWLIEPPASPMRCFGQIRHMHKAAACAARIEDGGRLHVLFDEPQTAITPGQAIVLHDQDVLLGGGWIERATDGERLTG
jgi:tRNA-specific 2-thiouridylase